MLNEGICFANDQNSPQSGHHNSTFNIQNSAFVQRSVAALNRNLPHKKKTKSGYSTNAEVLEDLKDVHEIIPKILDIIIVSSIKNYNIDILYNALNKYSKNNSIYLIGNTNSGKSTLLNKLIKNYSQDNQPNITVSMYPSTTLDKVEIKSPFILVIGNDNSRLCLAHKIDNYYGFPDGISGKDLYNNGIEQAKNLGEVTKNLKFDVIFTSD